MFTFVRVIGDNNTLYDQPFKWGSGGDSGGVRGEEDDRTRQRLQV